MLFLQVGSNGLISFSLALNDVYRSLFPTQLYHISNCYVVAPFWADVDTRRDGMIQYQVFEATNSNDRAIITIVNDYMFHKHLMIVSLVCG